MDLFRRPETRLLVHGLPHAMNGDPAPLAPASGQSNRDLAPLPPPWTDIAHWSAERKGSFRQTQPMIYLLEDKAPFMGRGMKDRR